MKFNCIVKVYPLMKKRLGIGSLCPMTRPSLVVPPASTISKTSHSALDTYNFSGERERERWNLSFLDTV